VPSPHSLGGFRSHLTHIGHLSRAVGAPRTTAQLRDDSSFKQCANLCGGLLSVWHRACSKKRNDEMNIMRKRFLGSWHGTLAPLLLIGCSEVNGPSPSGNAAIAPAGSLDRASGAGLNANASAGPVAPPGLGSLTVSPMSLSPHFDPVVHDYAIRCAAGANTLSLAFTAAPGSTAALISPSTAPMSSSPVAVQLLPDQAAVIETTDGFDASQEYWIRCLPPDFPTIIVTAYPRAGAPSAGWYLVADTLVPAGQSGFAMILDALGTPVWYRRAPVGVVDVDHYADNIVVFSPEMPPTGGQFEIDNLVTGQTQFLGAVNAPTDHHEFQELHSGHRVLISVPVAPGIDLTGLAGYGTGTTVEDCLIQELDQTGALVWQWKATDHIDPARETSPAFITDGQAVVDVFHCNAVDVDGIGNLIVSARHLNSVFYVSRSDGHIMWKMGGSPYNKDGARYIQIVNDPETAFYGQHDVRFEANGEISLFDDHTGMPGQARGVVYSVDVNAGTAQFAWQYLGSVSSGAMGSFRRYPDGSSVIGWGLPGRDPGLVFTEVNAAGQPLLDLSFGGGQSSYRALKYPLSAFAPDLLRASAGLP